MKYTERQIRAAKDNAKLHKIYLEISDKQAFAFLDWYYSHRTHVDSVYEAIRIGLSGLRTVGIRQQIAAWEDILGIDYSPR
ncbi:hypothetical protein [Halotia branconii]|uniref:Uncharacterized protein n=1 Tax=Halotia branconii CENA392 TaxID=1539056 RepID=A0AAJ6NYH8_9CYAN|nr:hypothetical protein [Halotia branconii]WGV29089.1 hypothetical protein QI031_31510 [Halotia branconii CENA392]